MNGQIIYSRQSISPVLFKKEVLGSQTKIVISGFKGVICLPKIENSNPGKFSQITNPIDFDNGVLNLIQDEPVDWGRQMALPGGETAVFNYLLQFHIAKTKKLASKQMEQIELELEKWFVVLRDWIEVLSHQDLSIDEPLSGTQDSGNYIWSWKSKKIWRNATSAMFYVTTSAPDTTKAIDIGRWEISIDRTNKKLQPPEEQLILRDARARFRRTQYKYSAIFQGVATELTLKKKIETVLVNQGNPKKYVDLMLNNPLGKIFDICEALGIDLPDDCRKISKLRNSAAHKDSTITKQAAAETLDIATKLVDMYGRL